MPLIIPSNSITGGYEVANSLRFDDGSTDYLDRTPASTSDRKTATFSSWIKFGNIITEETFFSCFTDANNQILFQYQDHRLRVFGRFGGTNYFANTSALYRDPSAWYHIVIAFDTTQGTASNRMRFYVNGNEITNFNSATYPSLNAQLEFNTSSVPMWIGGQNTGVFELPFDGYMAEVCWIDGSQLDPTSFGEFDADTGIWKPIDVSGLTFGTNGFYLPFENSGALGQDDSGNGNNFTVNNLTSDDQMIDTPTNNFCTLNPLFRGGEVGETLEEGNLFYDSGDGLENFVCATQSVSTGKWYFEILPSATDTNGAYGFTNADNLLQTTSLSTSPYDLNIGGMIRPDGNGTPNYKINSTATNISVTTTSVFGIALDADTGDIEFFENNVSVGSGTITGITNYIPFANCHSSSTGRRGIATFNFGQDSSFAGSKTRQNNTDNNGQGDFYYAPPSGYYALNTKNLAEYG